MNVIRKASETILDVFVGTGWTNWSRFEIVFMKNRLQLKLIKGRPMNPSSFKQLYEELSK